MDFNSNHPENHTICLKSDDFLKDVMFYQISQHLEERSMIFLFKKST